MRILKELSCSAIIFDKDGTLIDSESLWFAAIERVLQQRGCVYDVQTHARVMGGSMDSCLRILAERNPGVAVSREELYASFEALRREVGIVPMPGASALLAQCFAAGIPMALATSSRRADAEMEITSLGWRSYFSAIVTADDVVRQKPAPDIYLQAARRLGISPASCLAVEDGINGARSAKDAGMRVVFIRDARFGLVPPSSVAATFARLTEL